MLHHPFLHERCSQRDHDNAEICLQRKEFNSTLKNDKERYLGTYKAGTRVGFTNSFSTPRCRFPRGTLRTAFLQQCSIWNLFEEVNTCKTLPSDLALAVFYLRKVHDSQPFLMIEKASSAIHHDAESNALTFLSIQFCVLDVYKTMLMIKVSQLCFVPPRMGKPY